MKFKFDRNEVMKLVSSVTDKKAKITIVKDDGVYLMTFGQPVGKRDIVYAKGHRPGDNYLGGDDFGDDFASIGEFEKMLAESEGDITVVLTATQIKTEYTLKMTDKMKAEHEKKLAKYWEDMKIRYRSEPLSKLIGYLSWYKTKPRSIKADDRKKRVALILEVMKEKNFTPSAHLVPA